MSHLTVQQLSASMDGAVTGPSLEVVVRHLAVCAECRERQARLARHDDVLRRLLAPDTDEAFLDSLSRRGEDVAVAIACGLTPPEMWTTVPLQQDEDPHAVDEPPAPSRPALGATGAVAQEAGYGLIGMKPVASTQPPMADAAEAQRWMEALESGATPDPNAFMVSPRGPAEPSTPAIELPNWMVDRAARDRTQPPASPAPRETQPLRLVPELPPPVTPVTYGPPYAPPPASHVPPGYAPPPTSHAAPPYAPPYPDPARAGPPYAAPPPAADPYASRLPAAMPTWAPAPTQPHLASFDDEFYDDEPEPEFRGSEPTTTYATRSRALAAARRRALEEARQLGIRRHWMLAGGALGVLLIVVLLLQLLPVSRGKSEPMATTPRVPSEFARTDSLARRVPRPPDVRSAALGAPVEQLVPSAPRGVTIDTATVAPEEAPEDSADVESEQ